MADGKPTYVARYIEKFLAQTFLMDAETVGAMVLLEAFAWIQEPPCTLPMDDAALERYAKVSPGRWSVIGPKLIACFYVSTDGRWFNPSLFEDYERSLSRMKVNRENGAKGGKARVSQAVAKQSLSKRLATTPSVAQALDRDREIDRDREKNKTTTTAREATSLSGIELDENQVAGADKLFNAATDAMRPKGNAGANWVLPLHEANRLSGIIDATMKAGTALIDGREWHPWELADEYAAAVRGSNPAGLNALCNFIDAVWKRCQRSGCKPGDPHKSTPLKIEKGKQVLTQEQQAAKDAAFEVECERISNLTRRRR